MSKPLINASTLDKLVELRHRVLTKGANGEDIPSWPLAYARVWAEKADARGMKRFTAQTIQPEQMTEFRMRFRSDVSTNDHLFVVDTGAEYEIQQVAEMGRNEGLDLLCRRIQS